MKVLELLKDHLLYFHVFYNIATRDESYERCPLEKRYRGWQSFLAFVDPKQDTYALMEFVRDNSIDQFQGDAQTLLGLLK